MAACCALALCLAGVLAGCSSSAPYEPESKSPELSTPVIGKSGTLRVGVNTNNPPLAGQASKIVGIDVDIAAALADELGLKLEIVDVGSDPAGALEEGTVDVVMGIDKSNTEAAMWKSSPYLETAVALFSTSPNAAVPTTSSNPTIAAQVSSMSAWTVTNEFGTGVLKSSTDLNGAFSELSSGKVQYVAADAVIGTYAAHTADLDATIVALMQQPGGYCVGVLDTNSALKQVVSDALATLVNGGMVDVIELKWLGTTLDLSSVAMTAGATAPAATAESEPAVSADDEAASADEPEADASGTTDGEGQSKAA